MACYTLIWTPNSPFARKAIMGAYETGVKDNLILKHAGDYMLTGVGPSPIAPSVKFDKLNPSGRVPVLITPEGRPVFGSQAILQFWDIQASPERKLFKSGEEKMDDILLESLADGLLDAALQLRYETVARPEELRWTDWSEGWKSKISRSLIVLNGTFDRSSSPHPALQVPTDDEETLRAGSIAVVSALWYLERRFSGVVEWRHLQPLVNWYDNIIQRVSWVRAEGATGDPL